MFAYINVGLFCRCILCVCVIFMYFVVILLCECTIWSVANYRYRPTELKLSSIRVGNDRESSDKLKHINNFNHGCRLSCTKRLTKPRLADI